MNKTSQISDSKSVSASSQTSSTSSTKTDDTKSFKDELVSVNDKNINADGSAQSEQNGVDGKQVVSGQDVAAKNAAQQLVKDKNAKAKSDADSKDKTSSLGKNGDDTNGVDALVELNSKIATLSSLKNGSDSAVSKVGRKISDFDDSCKTLNFDKSDAMFFANLVKNEQFSVQAQSQANMQGNDFSNNIELKSDASLQNVQVSSALMDSLNQSYQTNKPFRIDFDNNISVIMKVGIDGKLSADFIPGDKAVENYLRNNIPLLQQSFDEQNLPYSNLSYRQSKNQQEQQNSSNNRKNKENDDE